MPGPGTFFAIGAAGVAGATAFANRHNKKKEDLGQDNMTPHVMGRRRSKGTENDFYEPRKQVCDACDICTSIKASNTLNSNRQNTIGDVIMVSILATTLISTFQVAEEIPNRIW